MIRNKPFVYPSLIVLCLLLISLGLPITQAVVATELPTRMYASETQAAIIINHLPSRIIGTGDFNGDGADDFLIEYNSQPPFLGIVVFEKFGIIFGKRNQTDKVTIDLSKDQPDLSLATNVKGVLGVSRLARLGDLNGDGIDDLILTQTGPSNVGAQGAPILKVIFGSSQLHAGTLDLDDVRPDLTIVPNIGNLVFAVDLLGVADMNGDGITDVVLAENSNYVFFAAPIFFGPFSAGETIDLKSRKPDVVIRAYNLYDSLSAANVFLCDINGDHIADLVLKEPRFDSVEDAVLHINTVFIPTMLDVVLGSTNLKRGMEISLAKHEASAWINTWANPTVFATGDINGDGIDDLVCGQSGALSYAPGGWAPGYVNVIFGSRSLPLSSGHADVIITGMPLPDSFEPIRGSILGDRFGASLAVGDIDGDGVSDILIGAPGVVNDGHGLEQASNRAHVILGSRELRSGAYIQLGHEQQDVTINFDEKARSIGSVRTGDFNGDGIADLLVGGGSTSYVFFGGAVRPPGITKARYSSDQSELSIIGSDFTGSVQVEVNGVVIERAVTFDLASGSLTLQGNPSELNLREAKNRVVVIRKGSRSNSVKIKLR